jgi:uroporphyrinogen decarboxylase
MLQNDLILRAAKGEKVERIPVWMMRQAGRVLTEYKAVRSNFAGFKEFVKNPSAAAEVTIQPVNIFGVDAAIIFSDILFVPEAMGIDYIMEESKGPVFPNPIKTESDIDNVNLDVVGNLQYVTDAISLTKKDLNGRVPLIGFAGAPWTIFSYVTEGSGSKTFSKAKSWLYKNPLASHKLLQKITDATIAYLNAQVDAGADMLQIFDSWAGVLSPAQYTEFAMPYMNQISDNLSKRVPVTLFAKGANFSLAELNATSCQALGLDWNITGTEARKLAPNKTLQGNFDPCALYAPTNKLESMVKDMITEFGTQKYIANLGHGLYPDIEREKAKAFVDAIKEFGKA